MEQGNIASPPYGPAANLKTIFDTWRDRSMPDQLGKEWLERIGLSSNLTAKNLHALRFLGLIDDAGYTTAVAQRLRGATSEEYPSVLEEIIRKAYAKVFEIRNPSIDSRTRVDDAFRLELPQAQRSRMVACFFGLCAMAGIPLKEAPPLRESQTRKSSSLPSKRLRTDMASPIDSTRVATLMPTYHEPETQSRNLEAIKPFNPVLDGLLRTVPSIDSAEELDEWYQVFRSAFLFVRSMASKTRNEVGT